MAGKPVSLTQVDENEYTGSNPQPLVVVGDIPGESTYTLPAATTTTLGGVKQAAAVDGDTGTVADIVTALQDAGIMASA